MLTAKNLEEKYFKNIREDLSNQTGSVEAIEEERDSSWWHKNLYFP